MCELALILDAKYLSVTMMLAVHVVKAHEVFNNTT